MKPPKVFEGSVQHDAFAAAVERLATASDTRSGDTDELVHARMAARTGNPEPLIAMLWPQLQVTEEEEKLLGRSIRLDDFQYDLICSVLSGEYQEVAVKGAASAGKGFAISIAVLLWYFIHPDALVVMTSASFDHVRKVIWAEVRKWFVESKIRMPGKMLKEQVDGGPKRYIKLANPDSDEAFAGHHSSAVLFVFDEATAVRDERYNLAKTQAHCIVSAANPRTLSGWFRSLFPKVDPDKTQDVPTAFGKRRLVSVDGASCANVRFDRMIIPGQLDGQRFKGLLAEADQRWVDVFAHGKFPVEDPAKQLIIGSWLERHEEAWEKGLPVEAFGLDVAASVAGDETVLAAGGAKGVAALHKVRKADTMETVGWVIATVREIYHLDLSLGQHPVTVDTDGLGKGVGDRLQELGVWVIPHTGNSPSRADARRYQNLRAESYGELARRLDPRGPWGDTPWAFPVDPKLREELVAPEKVIASDGIRFRITPKEVHSSRKGVVLSLRDKLGRSPDTSDAVVYLYLSVRNLGEYAACDYSQVQVAYSGEERVNYWTPEDTAKMPDPVKDLFEFFRAGRPNAPWGD
jgi:hypothetical protein